MKHILLITFGIFVWFLGACSDPSGEIKQGEIQKVKAQEEDPSNPADHSDSLYHSTDNSEDLKALREAQEAIEAGHSGKKDSDTQGNQAASGNNDAQVNGSDPDANKSVNVSDDSKKDEGTDQGEKNSNPDGSYPVDYLGFVQSAPGGTNLALASSATFMDATIAEKNKISVTITAVKEFSGNISCSLEMEEWELVDTNKDLKATLSPASFSIKGGESQVVTISVDVGSYAPAMANQHMHLLCSSDDPNFKKMFNEEIKFSVDAVANVYMLGGVVEAEQGEIWSTGRSQLDNGMMKFRQPVMLNFVVLDPSMESHVVHGNGNIPHQNTGANPVKGSPAYSVPLSAGNAASFYCHDHERGGLRQNVSVDAAP